MGVAGVALMAIAIYRVDRVPPSTTAPALVRIEPDPTVASNGRGEVRPPATAETTAVKVTDTTTNPPAPSPVEGFESFAPEPLAIAPIEFAALEQPALARIEALSVTPLEIPALNLTRAFEQ